MPDTNAGGNGQAPTSPASPGDGNGQAPTAPQNNAAGTPASGGQNGQAPTVNSADPYTPPSADAWTRTQQELAEARRDAAKYRDELKKRDDAVLSADQKRERDLGDAQKRALELELRVQQQGLELAAHKLAPQIGIADASAGVALVLAEHAHEVKYDERTGAPTNLDDLLKTVLKNHPILAAQQAPTAPSQTPRVPATQAASGGPTNPGRQAGNGGLTLEIIRAMPMRERMARMAEIDAWEKAQRTQQTTNR